MATLNYINKEKKAIPISSYIYDSVPIGTELFGNFVALPDGFLWAGTQVKGSDYPLLTKAYGKELSDTFIVGEGIVGRVPVCIDTTDPDFDTVGKTGGEKKHTLTVAELANHRHSYDYMTYNPLGATNQKRNAVLAEISDKTGFDEVFKLATAGGNQPHNNLQPYVVKRYIVKAYNYLPVFNQSLETNWITLWEGAYESSKAEYKVKNGVVYLNVYEYTIREAPKWVTIKEFKIPENLTPHYNIRNSGSSTSTSTSTNLYIINPNGEIQVYSNSVNDTIYFFTSWPLERK